MIAPDVERIGRILTVNARGLITDDEALMMIRREIPADD